MKFAVIVFPGANCDRDLHYAINEVLGEKAELVFHTTRNLTSYDAILLPGGFSYGDYLRSGAIAATSPLMEEIKSYADAGKPILGICNGFQILTEAHLLPGALIQNKHLSFMCHLERIVVHNNETFFTTHYLKDEMVHFPIAHKEGNYYCDEATLQTLKSNNQIVFTYENNPNGSLANIAGIVNKKGNVLGMMPHPERAVEQLLGSNDGFKLFQSMIENWRDAYVIRS